MTARKMINGEQNVWHDGILSRMPRQQLKKALTLLLVSMLVSVCTFKFIISISPFSINLKVISSGVISLLTNDVL